jgi:site-specific DNA recombinase
MRDQQDRLHSLRLLDEIETDPFSHKITELRDRIANVPLKLKAADRSRAEQADTAIRTFELSQLVEEKWLAADYAEKRHLLQILLLNCKLDGVSLVPTMRKPFDALLEGLVVPSTRGDRI